MTVIVRDGCVIVIVIWLVLKISTMLILMYVQVGRPS